MCRLRNMDSHKSYPLRMCADMFCVLYRVFLYMRACRYSDSNTREMLSRLLFNLAFVSRVRETVFRSGGIHALTSCAQAGGEHIKRKCVQAIEVRVCARVCVCVCGRACAACVCACVLLG